LSDRIIKNYDPVNHEITHDFLYNNNNWDIIELNYNIDSDQLKIWWDNIKENFSHMFFDFNKMYEKLNLEKSKEMVEQGYCGYYCGPIDGVTLAWPTERYEALPPPAQCSSEMYPEVVYDTFIDDAKIMPKLYFGYFKKLVEDLGVDAFRQAIVTRHYPGMYIRQHIDSKVLKLHIPIESNENSYFHFGKNKERSYHMKEGKAYILNTGDWHGTTNESEDCRSHIITRVTENHILNVIGLTNG
jgi:hypothetical protein